MSVVDPIPCRYARHLSARPYIPTTRIVQELLKYLSENPDLKGAFEKSFKKAQHDHPWLSLWDEFDVHSLDNYFRYMDEFVHWVPTENCEGTSVYNHLCFFYLILDLPPVRDYQSPIHPSSRNPWTWLSEWLIKYAKEMGRWMDSPGSFDPKKIEGFVQNPAYCDKDACNFYDQYPEPLGGWKTFNEFFARHINAQYRPIEDPEDYTVIVCPADCVYGGQWPIRDATVNFGEQEPNFETKGIPCGWGIRQFLDDGLSDLRSAFSGGVFTHSFLNMTNYHRIHAPVSGRVVQAKTIPGLCYVEVGVEREPQAAPASPIHGAGTYTPKEYLTMRRQMMPRRSDINSSLYGDNTVETHAHMPNSPGYQFLQARAMVLLDSRDIGLVAVLAIGMAQVSPAVLSVKEGDLVKKGQEIACFHFGDSDIVMVFQKGADVKLDQKPSGNEYFTKVGSKIGTAQRIVRPPRPT